MEFKEKLQTLRKEHHYSQEQLADQLMVSRQAVSKWESGSSYPETDKVIELSKLFQVSIDYLLNDELEEVSKKEPIINRNLEYENFHHRFSIAMTVGVGLCILGLILAAILDEVFPKYENLAGVAFLTCVLFAVLIFVYYGIQKSHYETIDIPKKKENAIASLLNSIIMMVATLIFLVGGLLYGLWHPLWIVFVIGGILCGIISIVFPDER